PLERSSDRSVSVAMMILPDYALTPGCRIGTVEGITHSGRSHTGKTGDGLEDEHTRGRAAGDGFGGGGRPELAHDRRDVKLDRMLADPQAVRDRFVREPRRQ